MMYLLLFPPCGLGNTLFKKQQKLKKEKEQEEKKCSGSTNARKVVFTTRVRKVECSTPSYGNPTDFRDPGLWWCRGQRPRVLARQYRTTRHIMLVDIELASMPSVLGPPRRVQYWCHEILWLCAICATSESAQTAIARPCEHLSRLRRYLQEDVHCWPNEVVSRGQWPAIDSIPRLLTTDFTSTIFSLTF